MHNIQESQPFGDSVTETIGGIICDSDIKEAPKSQAASLVTSRPSSGRNTTSTNMQSTIWNTAGMTAALQHEDQQKVASCWTLMQSSKTHHEACRKAVLAEYINKITKCNVLDIWIDGLQ